jgi:hypothetical protein
LLGFLFIGDPKILACGDGGGEHESNVRLMDHDGNRFIDFNDAIAGLGFFFLGTRGHVLGERCVDIPGCRPRCDL